MKIRIVIIIASLILFSCIRVIEKERDIDINDLITPVGNKMTIRMEPKVDELQTQMNLFGKQLNEEKSEIIRLRRELKKELNVKFNELSEKIELCYTIILLVFFSGCAIGITYGHMRSWLRDSIEQKNANIGN
jgi:hypothetical protein